jgi:hypothetical protein
MVHGCGPCVLLGLRLCIIDSRYVRGARSLAVYLWILVREMVQDSCCVVVN